MKDEAQNNLDRVERLRARAEKALEAGHAADAHDALGALAQMASELDERNRTLQEEKRSVERALYDVQRHEAQIKALLRAARDVLPQRRFDEAARVVLDTCQKLVGASAGYLALLSAETPATAAICVATAGLSCELPPDLPMPIRGMSKAAYNLRKAVFENDFPCHADYQYVPDGHIALANILYAPMFIGDDAVGLLGLANKPGGFTEWDALLTEAFGEYAALALSNSRALESLEASEERYRSLVELSPDGIAVHSEDRLLYANPGALQVLGAERPEEVVGRPNEKLLNPERQAFIRRCFESKSSASIEIMEGQTTRRDGASFYAEAVANRITYQGQPAVQVVIRDITERKRVERELQRYVAELRRRNEDLKQLAYVISHDLRAPLISIKGFLAELQPAIEKVCAAVAPLRSQLPEHEQRTVGQALDEAAPEALHFMESSTRRMTDLVDATLELSRLSRRELCPERINMDELVQRSLDALADEINQRRATVAVGPLPEVTADRAAMERIVNVLVSNAVLYLDPMRPGQIEIGGELREMEAAFWVRDNGRGIAQEEMDRVFAPFRRAGATNVPGDGMGLACAQMLVQRHGGHIDCESTLGQGSAFTFTISNRLGDGERRGA